MGIVFSAHECGERGAQGHYLQQVARQRCANPTAAHPGSAPSGLHACRQFVADTITGAGQAAGNGFTHDQCIGDQTLRQRITLRPRRQGMGFIDDQLRAVGTRERPHSRQKTRRR